MGTDLWWNAIEKEMKNVMPGFKFLKEDNNVPMGYQLIDCHMILDIKMDFNQNTYFVALGI